MSSTKMEAVEKIKSRWTRSFLTATERCHDEEKYICDICQKDLGNPSNLTLHRNTHVIERRYKCQPCQIPFKTQAELLKHQRSSLHESRLAKTEAFGIPTVDNPRPYRCPYCVVKNFTKHGHLAKHLRSKLHIQNLEAKGLVPEGTYSLFEKSGPQVRDSLDTSNCENSLESLQTIARSLFASDGGGTGRDNNGSGRDSNDSDDGDIEIDVVESPMDTTT